MSKLEINPFKFCSFVYPQGLHITLQLFAVLSNASWTWPHSQRLKPSRFFVLIK